MKRLAAGFISILLIITCMMPVQAANKQIISLGRISITMPQITVEVKGNGYSESDVSAKLGTEVLQVQSMEEYTKEDSVCTYILVDVSKTMRSTFDVVKDSINSYVDRMGNNDKVVIITFGDEVESILDGTETNKEIKKKVNDLECNGNVTLFYEALSEAYQLSNSSISQFDRELVIAFSDGVDDQVGQTTFEEIEELYETHSLPLYAACTKSKAQSGQNAVDKFGNLARSSGGSLKMLSEQKDFDKLVTEIEDVTLLKLKSESSTADGQKKQLSVKIGNSQVEYDVPVTRAMEDHEAPKVKKVRYVAESNLIIVDFSEAVLGANVISAYKITNKAGKTVGIESVEMSKKNAQVEIQLKSDVSNGECKIVFEGITDASGEKNPLTDEATVKIEGVKSSTGLIIVVIVVVMLVLGLVAALIIVLVVKNSKKKTDDDVNNGVVQNPNVVNRVVEHQAPQIINEKHHVKAESVTRIRLRIKTGRTSEQNIETNLVSSLIVGRSNTCDIYIDDTKLSRQHFVIESDGTHLYVMDLQSRNGTMLNGIRINGRQLLHNGDKIVAGLSDIYITILK